MITATVISDASFLGGNSSFRPESGTKYKKIPPLQSFGGWAAYVRVDGKAEPILGYGSIKTDIRLTSTLCEMYAALNGIWMAKGANAEQVLIRTDCMAVVSAISRNGLKKEMQGIWDELVMQAGVEAITVRAKHVKGHSRATDAASYVNRWCDQHARKGSKAAMRGHPISVLKGQL